jgi:hypothetical protein
MNYRQFVKENFHKLDASMPATERMRKIGEMWRKSGMAKQPKGSGVVGGRMKRQRKAKGGDIFNDLIGPAFDPLGLFTGGTIAGGSVKQTRKSKKTPKGKGFLSDALGSIGLGMENPNEEQGAGLFSGLLGSIGLGMDKKVLSKHHNRMMMLEKKLHETGKLTPREHHKLKVYHHLHGSGFFDSLFGGIKKGVSAVVNNLDTIKSVVPEVVKMIPDNIKQRAIGMLPGRLGAIANLANMAASA